MHITINADSIEELKQVCAYIHRANTITSKCGEQALLQGDNVLGEPLLPVPDEKPKKERKRKEKETAPEPGTMLEENPDPFGLNGNSKADSDFNFDNDFEEVEELTPPELTMELVRKAANSLAEKGKASEVKKLLTSMKLKSLAQLQPEHFHKFLTELEKIDA